MSEKILMGRIVAMFVGVLLSLAADDAYAKGGNGAAENSIASSLTNIATTYGQTNKRSLSIENEEAQCGSEKYGSNADRCAQWKAADAAASSAWWAWASGLVGLGSLAGVIGALGLALHANSIARRTARLQLRAYVSFQGMELRQIPATGSAQEWLFSFKWINSGSTPAVDVRFDNGVALGPWPLPPNYGDQTNSDVAAAMGPGQQAAGMIALNAGALADAVAKNHNLFLYCAAVYTDIYGQNRRSEVCQKVVLLVPPNTVDDWRGFGSNVGPFNGVDEGCMFPPK